MTGKKNFLLIFIVANIHGMQTSDSDSEKSSVDNLERQQTILHSTEEYLAYEKATQLHEKYKTPETHALMQEAADLVLQTPEYQLFSHLLKCEQQKIDFAEACSPATSMKHAIEQTPEFIQYQAAKINHEKYNTDDTAYILSLCAQELSQTQAFKNCQHVVEKKYQQSTQQPLYNFPGLTTEGKKVAIAFVEKLTKDTEIAREKITHTPEFQQCLLAKIEHEKHKTDETLIALKQSQYAVQKTKETFEYCKAKDLARHYIMKIRGYVPLITIEPHYPSCIFNYVENEKIMNKLNLDIIPIEEIKNPATTEKPVHTIYVRK